MPEKNQLLEVTIEDMTNEGEGIGHADGYTLFVKDAVIGDRVLAVVTKAKKSYGYARVSEVLEPSPDRIPPVCPEARRCGGCQLQELSYAREALFKEDIVRRNLTRIGGFSFSENGAEASGNDVEASGNDVETGGEEVEAGGSRERCIGTCPHAKIEPLLAAEEPLRYRNKAQYPVGRSRKTGKIVTGFYAGRTHDIIDVRDCALTRAHNADILKAILAFMEKYKIPAYDEMTGKGLVRHILIREGFATGEIMVCLILNGPRLPHADDLVHTLSGLSVQWNNKGKNSIGSDAVIKSICFNINEKRTNVILGDRVLPAYGNPWITDRLGRFTFRISPLSFYQVNSVQALRLYETAVEFAGLHGTETVFDLFCGIGTISLFIAEKAREVYGVEIVPQAIRDAKENAERNGITNVHFFAGAAEDIAARGSFDEKTPLIHPDVVVLDPPRKGCEQSLLATIRRLAPDRIVYVSCDSATLARDLRFLVGAEQGAAGIEQSAAGTGSDTPETESASSNCRTETMAMAEKKRSLPAYRLERVRPVDLFPRTCHVETVCLISRVKD